MKYMGGKGRIAKYIIPLIQKQRLKDQIYIEPFCGGCNVIDKVKGQRIASDVNPYLIAMWQGLQQGINKPMLISYDLYSHWRNVFNKTSDINILSFEEKFLIGWVGFMASFNGRFFDGGYNGNYTKRNYTQESINNILLQIKSIQDIEFRSCGYDELEIPKNSIIYCDIPYMNTKQYLYSSQFNHNKFWEWVSRRTNDGHLVFVSEYNAPTNFVCIWEKEVSTTINPNITMKPIEKLFVHKSIAHLFCDISSKQIELF